jgi:ABC-2 type transport system ATP-binding protein
VTVQDRWVRIPSVVAVDDLVVRLGGQTVVGGISFSVAPGEVYGLLGPNGAGKTTTVRVLTTLLPPTAGRALVAGRDVCTDSLDVRASLGYVPQGSSADRALTVRENLELYARAIGVRRRLRQARIDEAIETMGLGAVADSLAETLSGGTCRRLEIATALLGRPAVLLLDEPTAGLDPAARYAVWERLHLLREQHSTAILVTTHLMQEAERHCDRLAIIDRGLLVDEGSPVEIRGRFGAEDLDEVFTSLTERPYPALDDDEGGPLDGRDASRAAG